MKKLTIVIYARSLQRALNCLNAMRPMLSKNDVYEFTIETAKPQERDALLKIEVASEGCINMTDQVGKYQTINNKTIYTHKECSLNPDFSEPDWKQFDLISVEEVAPGTTCAGCKKTLTEEPPVFWSKLKNVEEVYKALSEQRKERG